MAYGRGKKVTNALVDFNLTVAAGETVALLGPSGSGKSTALNALAGLPLLLVTLLALIALGRIRRAALH